MIKTMQPQADINVMSHEIRTPLNGLVGLLAMLKEYELPEPAMQLLERMDISAETLLGVLNNTIEVQRIQNNQVVFSQREFSLLEIAENCVRMYSADAESKGVELGLQFDPRLIGKSYIGDSERLSQIISALVSNATKFTQNGSAILTLALKKEKVTSTQIVVRVLDTGAGIEPHELDKICAPYYQTLKADGSRPSGTGAGLYIADNLLRLMGSQLVIDSASSGSSFSFTLDLPVSNRSQQSWVATGSATKVNIYAPADAQIELVMMILSHYGLEAERFGELTAEALHSPAALNLVDYRVAAANLVVFRKMVETLPGQALCVLTSEFEPATALLAKGAQQWYAPYLPSALCKLCQEADLVELEQHDAADTTHAPELPEDLSIYSILCVDDSPTNLIVLVGALTKLGFNKVLRAADGQQAVEAMLEHPEVDLVLMDFHMPRLNGAEAARKIRENGASVPILGVTALSEADINNQISDTDFEQVITKPVRSETLETALARWLPRHSKDV
mgnify:FL=1